MSSNFVFELQKVKKKVWNIIIPYLSLKEPFAHYKLLREYPERQGKYFRPALVLWSAQMFGAKPQKALLTAAAMQVSEDWLLIHDDFEDHSVLRRGKPSLNVLYGDELSVNAGDALHLIMWKMMGDNVKKLGQSIGWKVFDKLYEVIMKATEGQFLELLWIRNKKIDVTEREYIDMITRKTAWYTVVGPLQLGALVAGANKRAVDSIKRWGIPFGQAFQIWDDAMDIASSTKSMGKEHGGDIMEGKRTLLLSHLLKKSTLNERRLIRTIYLRPQYEKTRENKNSIVALMKKYKSIEYAENIARRYIRKAQSSFDLCTKKLEDNQGKRSISEAMQFVINRSY